jgi:hypothetical protein
MSPPEEDDETLVAGQLILPERDADDGDDEGETLLAAPMPVMAHDPRRAAAIMGERATETRPLPLPTPPPAAGRPLPLPTPPPRPGSAPPPAIPRAAPPPADFEPITHTMELPRVTPPLANPPVISGPEPAMVEPATLVQRSADVEALLAAPSAEVVLAPPEGTPPLVIRFLLVCGMLTVIGLMMLIYLQL